MSEFNRGLFGFKRSSLSSTAILAVAISAGLGVAMPAWAQQADDEQQDNSRLEDVIVTARKRDENIDVVPLAITAMTSETITNRNIDTIEDVAAYTPGFYTQAQTGTGTGRNDRSFRQLTFRGIGANTTNVGPYAGGVAFMDGAPVLNSALSNVQDVERVEVLRGPQAVYFGRSAFIGAINYITKDPTDYLSGRASLEVGEDNLLEASGAISGPLIEDFAFLRISGRRFEKDGQWVTANSGRRLGDQSTDSISATLLLRFSDDFRMRTFFNHFEDDDGPGAQYTVAGRTVGGTSGSNCNLGGTLGAYICGEVPQEPDPAFISANVTITPDIYNGIILGSAGIRRPFNYADDISDYGLVRKADQVSHRIDYTFGDTGPTFTSNTAYHRERIVTLADLAFRVQPQPLAAAVGYDAFDWSQELRLVSNQDSRLRWVAGANYVKVEQSTSGITGFFPPFGILNFGALQVGYTRAETPAVFGGVYYDILPDLTLTVEGRYQEDKLSGHFATSATAFVDITDTFESFSPRVSLDYRLTPNSTVYALFSRGFKPGGFNQGILTQPQFILDQFASIGAGRSYDEEMLDNYEAGIRGSFLDNRVRVALNGYIGKYTDAQIPILSVFFTQQLPGGQPNTAGPTNAATLVRNVGDVDLQGVEFEAEAVPIPGLRLGATFAYNHTEVKNWFLAQAPNFLAQNATNNIQVTSTTGNRLAGTPELTYTLSASYERDLGQGFSGYVGGDYLYRGSYFAEEANIAESGDREVFNARLGFNKDNYSVELYARNLFDDLSPAGINYQSSEGAGTGNSLRISLPERRRIGLRANINF